MTADVYKPLLNRLPRDTALAISQNLYRSELINVTLFNAQHRCYNTQLMLLLSLHNNFHCCFNPPLIHEHQWLQPFIYMIITTLHINLQQNIVCSVKWSNWSEHMKMLGDKFWLLYYKQIHKLTRFNFRYSPNLIIGFISMTSDTATIKRQ
jgi:hypothetical protein